MALKREDTIGAFGLRIRTEGDIRPHLTTRMLQVQVIKCIDLITKDRNGYAEPCVTLWFDKDTTNKYVQRKRKKERERERERERRRCCCFLSLYSFIFFIFFISFFPSFFRYKSPAQRGTLSPRWEFERWTVRLPQSASVLWIRVEDLSAFRNKRKIMGMASVELAKGGFEGTPVTMAIALLDKRLKAKKNRGYVELGMAVKQCPLPPPPPAGKQTAQATDLLFRSLLMSDLATAKELLATPLAGDASYNSPCAHPRYKGAKGLPPLFVALSHPEPVGRLAVVHRLLEKGASPVLRIEQTLNAKLDQMTPLYYAATMGLPAECLALLTAAGGNSDPDHPSHCLLDMTSPLMAAVFHDHFKTMHALLSRGASVRHVNETSCTPLLFAARLNRSQEFLEALVEAGAEVNHQTTGGSTALFEYARHGNVRAVEYLLSMRAVNMPVSSGMTPLFAALAKGHVSVAMALVPSTHRDNLLEAFVVHTSPSGLVGRLNALGLATLLLKKGLVRTLVEHGASTDGKITIGSNSKPVSAVIEGLGFGEYLH